MKIRRASLAAAMACLSIVGAPNADPAWAQADPGMPGSPLTLQAYTEQVVAQNTSLAALGAAVEASRERVPQAGTLADPMVGLSFMNVPFSFDLGLEPMTMKQLTVTQAFPAPGVLSARTQTAQRGVEVSRRMLGSMREMIVREARLVYLDLYLLERSLEVVQENQALLRQFIQVADSRYTTGRGIQQDVLKAQLEHSRLTEKRIILEEQRVAFVGRLNALRNMPATTPVDLAGLPGMEEVRLSDDALTAAIVENNPDVLQARALVDRQTALVELARRLRLPGWSLSANYAQRDGRRDFLTAMVSLQVPLYAGRKQDRAIAEQRSELVAAEYRLQDAQRTTEASATRLGSELRRIRRLMVLYADEILPQAEGVLTSALAGYRVDQVDFLTLLSAQTTLFNYQLDAIRVTTDYHRRLAELEALAGMPLSGSGSGQ